MTEAPKPVQPNERNTDAAGEMPLREVYKLPSQTILDGIYTGRIGNPEALRAYFIRQRTEFLQAHPDREHELDEPGTIGRWHGLVHSDTVEEYAGLASFAESELHRRSTGLSDTQADSSTQRQGVANFRRMAHTWRQRAARFTETESQTQPAAVVLPESPAVSSRDVTPLESAAQEHDYSRMQDYEVLDGINNGTLTETDAVRVYVRKSLDSVRELYEGEERREKETEYVELVYGEPADLIRFCVGRASEQLAYGLPPPAVAPGSYEVAGRWYAMAGRFAEEAAQERRDKESQVNEDQ